MIVNQIDQGGVRLSYNEKDGKVFITSPTSPIDGAHNDKMMRLKKNEDIELICSQNEKLKFEW